MSLWNIWQALGTPQVAEITALVGIVISVLLARKSVPVTERLCSATLIKKKTSGVSD